MSKRNAWHFRLFGSIVTAALLVLAAGCSSSANQDRPAEQAEASAEVSARTGPGEPASGPVVQPPLPVQSKVAVKHWPTSNRFRRGPRWPRA